MKKIKKIKAWMPEYRAFCKKVVSHLQYKMFLGMYGIDLGYKKEPKEGKLKKSDDNCVAADIVTDHRYYTATINLYPETHALWRLDKHTRIVEIIVHELCHIITDPLYKLADQNSSNATIKFVEDIREQSTQHITNIVMCYLELEAPELLTPPPNLIAKVYKK